MFGSEILEVAIGLFFIYFLLSMVASALREVIESATKTRAADLYRGIRELLGGSDTLAKELYEHPLVHSLYLDGFRKPEGWRTTMPSYIPSANFALALLDMAARPASDASAAGPPPKLTLDSLEAGIQSVPNDKVRRALQVAVDRAEGDLGRAQDNVEAWFNSSMDRVSGWYKRRTQYILFGIGFVVAVLANVDTIEVARYLYQNDRARAVVAVVAVRAAMFTAAMGGDGVPTDTIPEAIRKRLAAELDTLKAAGLPVGWRLQRATPPPEHGIAGPAVGGGPAAPRVPGSAAGAGAAATLAQQPPRGTTPAREATDRRSALSIWGEEFAEAFWRSLPGWLLTGLAVSFGAPFWFDVLNKVMVIRSTVKPNEKSPNEGSEDRQPRGGAKPPKLGGGEEPQPTA